MELGYIQCVKCKHHNIESELVRPITEEKTLSDFTKTNTNQSRLIRFIYS